MKSFNLDDLIKTGKQVLAERREGGAAIGLPNHFMEGFAEGIAEMIAVLTKEPAADILEAID